MASRRLVPGPIPGVAAHLKILIVTDAWSPQVNGVVRTLTSTRAELRRLGHHVELLTPREFRTTPVRRP
jgi:hypothetical protein